MSEKSEMQKHLDGELFWNSDPEISAAKSRARALCDEYNLTKENQPPGTAASVKGNLWKLRR